MAERDMASSLQNLRAEIDGPSMIFPMGGRGTIESSRVAFTLSLLFCLLVCCLVYVMLMENFCRGWQTNCFQVLNVHVT